MASVDDHTLQDPEISDTPDFRETFPPHCLRGTEGQKKIAATAMRSPVVVANRPEDESGLRARLRGHRGEILIEKSRFDVFTNPNTVTVVDALAPERSCHGGPSVATPRHPRVPDRSVAGGCLLDDAAGHRTPPSGDSAEWKRAACGGPHRRLRGRTDPLLGFLSPR